MLHTLSPAAGSRHAKKRVARGNSAGGGTTGGRGTKGQQSRTGKGKGHRNGFEGGQVPLLRRQPKMGGFKRARKVHYEIVNLDVLEETLEAGTYDIAALRAKKIVRSSRPVKILQGDKLSKAFTLTVHAASRGAKEAVEKAGGSVTLAKLA